MYIFSTHVPPTIYSCSDVDTFKLFKFSADISYAIRIYNQYNIAISNINVIPYSDES